MSESEMASFEMLRFQYLKGSGVKCTKSNYVHSPNQARRTHSTILEQECRSPCVGTSCVVS